MTIVTLAPDLVAIKARQQKTWASGDYGTIATGIVPIAEQLCETIDLHAGDRVLDVAAGTGNAAIAAARRYAVVTATDYVPELLDRARERAAAERLPMTIQVADAEALPFADNSYDVVISVVGAMFTANQEKAASELLRVCRPGGKIGMSNWTPEGFIGQVFKTIGRHVPPPAGVKGPPLWGTEARLQELFGDGISSLRVVRRHHVFRYRSPEHWLESFRTFYGPMLKAFESLDAAGQEKLTADLVELGQRFNQSGDQTFAAPAEYLDVIAIKKQAGPERGHPEDWR